MPKKKVSVEETSFVETVAELKQEFRRVDPLNVSFNQEDLNKLRDKVNELVDLANK